MLVSVEQWRTATHEDNTLEFVAVQLEHFGFTLTRSQAAEFCRKLKQLRSGNGCHTDDDDTLFMDLDGTTDDSAFVILALASDSANVRWFCDIPMSAAMELEDKLVKRLRSCSGEINCATT